MKKKVVIFTGAISSGGAEKQSILLAKALNNDYNVLLISYFGNKELKRYLDFLIEEDISYCQLKGGSLKRIREFYSLIKIRKPDVIINFLPSNNVIGGLIGKYLGVQQIFGGVRSSRQSFIKYLELLFSHLILSDVTIFNNYAGLEYFSKKGFNKRKSLVIHNCIYPSPEKRLKTNSSNDIIKILIVSRFEYYKDYETSLRAVRNSIEFSKKKNIELIIVGTGSQEESIRKKIIDLGLNQYTRMYINPENIYDYYKEADIFLQTSLFEGLSNSIMEAMSFGLPIVATKVGDNNFLIKDSINGFLTDVKDVELLTNKLNLLIDSKEIREEMGNNSFEMIKSDFSLDNYKEKFSNLIK